MCMCMLSKRTNILFDENLWQKLSSLAKKTNTSVGQLTREAVILTFFPGESESRIKNRSEAIRAIRLFREKYTVGGAKKDNIVTLVRKMREDRTKYLMSLLKHK